jgi:hypothetical protein
MAEEYGGSAAGDFRHDAILAEELGPLSLASCHSIHADIVAPYLVDLTTEGQRQRWLPGFGSWRGPDRERNDRAVWRHRSRPPEAAAVNAVVADRWRVATQTSCVRTTAWPQTCGFGGAEGIRTPDLLIANETRYQLRHSPGCVLGRGRKR